MPVTLSKCVVSEEQKMKMSPCLFVFRAVSCKMTPARLKRVHNFRPASSTAVVLGNFAKWGICTAKLAIQGSISKNTIPLKIIPKLSNGQRNSLSFVSPLWQPKSCTGRCTGPKSRDLTFNVLFTIMRIACKA